ncbi:hypothetical protein OHO83_17520 [Streptomyces sp. NBC_00569]|uniref:ApeA N-terminal domain 1-containing protein n=1 Tax=unclassified Streptomyces TaxID=2593676 RepID=UPI002252A67F|nr:MULTISPECIES: HEPN domain-containing protein [unclassified Streptomyces]MCX5439592.1 hypothetical protein [Streptomyces sp. NBC_00063]WUB93962.1 hypothetical protein OHO83_17520 [Streptomyces sp. NBC_00569]
MNERIWRGHWWETTNPEVKVPGTLRCTEAGDVTLELIGGFDIKIRQPLPNGAGYSVSGKSRTLTLIHGTSGKDDFTLLDVSHTGSRGSLFGDELTEQNWSAIRALRGIHLGSLSTPVFTRARLGFERLLQWSERTAFEISAEKLEGEARSSRRVEKVPVESLVAKHGDLEISLRHLSRDFDSTDDVVANERSFSAQEAADLTLTPPGPVHCKYFDEVEKDLQDLFTLSTYEPCGAVGRWLMYTSAQGRTKEVEVIGRQIYRTVTPRKRSAGNNALFTLGDVDFTELIPKWLETKGKARAGCNILFGLRYIERGYIGTRLLGVASAAESIHRSLRSASTPIPKREYRRLKEKILAALSDEDAKMVAFVKNGLHNNPTYNERMLELASIPDEAAVNTLLGDHTRWATDLKKARNDLAHANERSSSGGENTEAFWLLEVTYALLCLVLMSEIGISPERQRRAVEENSLINRASGAFKKDNEED